MSSIPLARIQDLRDVFMQDANASVSWSSFLACAHRLADRLPAGSHVVNLCESRHGFMLSFVAALIAERITVLPLAPTGSAVQELTACYPVGCILVDEAKGPGPREACPGSVSVPVLPVADIPSGGFRQRAQVPAFDGERVACIVFSSGSTGTPTSHVKHWGTLARAGLDIGSRFGFSVGGQAVVGTVPSRHMFGLETTVMLPLQWGSTVYAGRPLLPADVDTATRLLKGERWLMTTPIQLRALADDGLCRARFEAAISATMPLSESLAAAVERRYGAAVHEIYGCTEAGSLATRRTTQSEDWETLEGIIVEDRGGNAWVSGGHVREPTPLADIVALTDARRFRLRGRAAHLVKVAGKRTSLEALNAVLNQIAGVVDGAFFVPETEEGMDTRLIALAVAPGLTPSALIAELRDRIDPVFLPRPLYLVPRLPRNDMGKLTRRDLAQMADRLCRTDDAEQPSEIPQD